MVPATSCGQVFMRTSSLLTVFKATYLPVQAWDGNLCDGKSFVLVALCATEHLSSDCSVKPDPTQTFNGTWMATSSNSTPAGPLPSLDINFQGSDIYMFFITGTVGVLGKSGHPSSTHSASRNDRRVNPHPAPSQPFIYPVSGSLSMEGLTQCFKQADLPHWDTIKWRISRMG